MGTRLRVNRKGAGSGLPFFANAVLSHLFEYCRTKGLPTFSYVVAGPLPLSQNHQLTHTRYSARLRPEVDVYRWATKAAAGSRGNAWKPTGVTAAVILFESPHWVTKKYEVRQDDVDNKIKGVLDAAKIATGVDDSRHWQVHAFKVLSNKTRTVVYLFDLGDLVDHYD